MLRRAGYLAITVALLVSGALPVAWAASSRIQQARVRKIRACVLRIPSLGEPVPANGPTNPYAGATTSDPDAVDNLRSPGRNQLLFYVMDQRSDLKPDGWEFTNPAAPPYATLEIAQRYGVAQGTAIKPSMAPYWELTLSEANYAYLSDMDVIYIPICRRDQSNNNVPETPYPTFFTEEQRRVLTKLADSGVTIWVDWAVGSATLGGALGGNEQTGATPAGHNKNPFFTNLDFFSSANAVAQTPLAGHPLLTNPYVFQAGEAQTIGSAWKPNDPRPSIGRVLELRALDMQPTCNFAAVVPTSIATANPQDGAYIAAGRMGAGYIVATAGNVGGALGSVTGAEVEDLKFGYNVCAWAGEVTASQKNGRHTAQSSSQINGMIEQWTYPNLVQQPSGLFESFPPRTMPVNQLAVNMVPPLIIDNVVVSANLFRPATGAPLQSWINAFEVRPEDDFDGDNYTDDPITASAPANDPLADLSVGQSYDRVMGVNPPGAIYGMIAGEVPEAGPPQGAKAYVFAAGPSGLYSLPAPRPGLPPTDYWTAGNLKSAPSTGVAYNAAPGFAILPGANGYTRPELYAGGVLSSNPIFGSSFNGKLVAFPVGVAGAIGNPNWYYPPTQESNRLGLISGPIVTANVVDKGTGAIDTMLFVTSCASGDTSGGQTGNGAGDTTGKVEGFVVATRGDVLTFPKNTGNPNANNINSGRRFVCARWIDIPPGQGQVPQARELMWDPSRHYEVRVMDKQRNYVLLRYISEVSGMLNLLPDGTAGQVELPAPPTGYSVPGQPGVWDTSRYVFLADYSPLPQPVDGAGATIRPRFSPQTPYVRGIQQVVLPTGVGGGVSVGPDNRVYYGTGIGYMCSVEWNRGQPKFAWKMRGVAGEFNNNAGQNKNVDMSTALVAPTNSPSAPNYLDDYAFVSSPAAGKRIVFASRRTGTVYMMEPNASISFKLIPTAADVSNGLFPLNAQSAQNVMLAADHGIGFNSNSPYIRATQQPWGRLPNQFTVDPDTGTVTFLNMENFSLDLSLAQSPDQLMVQGIDTGGKPAVPIQWKFVGELGNGRTAWIPLPVVAVYQPLNAEHWVSGPVISGDRVYLMGPSGIMHEFPLDPKTVDPSFPRRGSGVVGLAGHNVGNITLYGPNGLVRTRSITVGTGIPTVAPPAISDRFVAVCTPRGLTAYAAPNVLVADSNRIIEATGDATAVASADVVVKHRINLSDFAIPTDPPAALLAGNPVILTERQFLNRPAAVRKLTRSGSLTSLFNSSNGTVPPVDSPAGIKETSPLADESYLTVDTGNNRIVEFNPGGKVVGEWAEFQDPFNMLQPGETTKLSGPMDVQRWVETETVGGTTVYVLHTLIADTGNTRVVEVVDKIQYQQGNFTSGSFVTIPAQVGSDGQPVRWYHVLVWASQTNAQGLKLRYRTAQRIFWPDANGNLMPIAGGGTPSTLPPYLPVDRYLSYTMATVQGQTVQYPSQGLTVSGYHQYYGGTQASSVVDRIPQARGGGDSIVFLRGRYKIDETTGGTPAPVTPNFDLREMKPGNPNAEKFRFAQGVIDPNVPILSEISDELLANGSPASNNPVHRINGVASVQRTIRTDIKFAPWTYTSSVAPRYPYFLIADVDGVWECRMMPGTGGTRAQYCLTMAFTNEDYAYVTGAGNGDPTRLYSTSGADHTPGGRRFSAASARRMPNGLILITSRTGANELPAGGASAANSHWHVGADVFLLRASDYLTASDRANYSLNVPYWRVDTSNPANPRHTANEHGWQPDQWVQQQFSGAIPAALRGTPSIRWRASEPGNPNLPPTVRTQFTAPGGTNPNELFGSYQPSQPAFADLVY